MLNVAVLTVCVQSKYNETLDVHRTMLILCAVDMIVFLWISFDLSSSVYHTLLSAATSLVVCLSYCLLYNTDIFIHKGQVQVILLF